jgi:hypothetical protein
MCSGGSVKISDDVYCLMYDADNVHFARRNHVEYEMQTFREAKIALVNFGTASSKSRVLGEPGKSPFEFEQIVVALFAAPNRLGVSSDLKQIA